MTISHDMIHATAVAIDKKAVLLRGLSGSGKSDLALRLIDRGAVLISDDQVALNRDDNGLVASAPEKLAGLIEVRNLGICKLDFIQDVEVALIVNLSIDGERYPMDEAIENIAGVAIDVIYLNAFENSAAIKVEMALKKLNK